jgi:hypothetical protein
MTGDDYGWTKDDIDSVEDVLVRMRRAGLVPWTAISDGRTGSAVPWTAASGEEAADDLLGQLSILQVDRQAGQSVRVEVWVEAMGWLPRLESICNERGVPVYSGSGSVPVPAIRQAVLRAIAGALDEGQRTVLLQIGDLDLNGIRNIARPFAEDVAAFARDYGAPPSTVVVRRLLLTAAQAEQHVGERGRSEPSEKAQKAGWPYPFTAQAEALPPEMRDEIVATAIDTLHDVVLREQVMEAEAGLHEDARSAMREKLDPELAS